MAFLHIVGSIVAVMIFSGFIMWLAEWEFERNQRRERDELAIRLGVPLANLDDPDTAPKIFQLSSERFSNELLRNRVSDFAGAIRTCWSWLGFATQIIVLSIVTWQTFIDSSENAVYAWSIVFIAFFFWIMSVGFSLLCRLLTGRYPGQAKLARKFMAKFLNANPGKFNA